MLQNANAAATLADVHVHGDMKVAWFKDPDGHILSLVNR